MIKQRLRQEDGIAMVMALGMMAVFSIVAVSLMTMADGNRSRDRRDAANNLAYQAAEAGTDAYVAYLTENAAFPSLYMARGEATRTANGTNYPSSTVAKTTWTPGPTVSWTYTKSATSDTGWLTLANGYQYLIYVYPPNASLGGVIGQVTRLDVIGRPNGSTNTTQWRTLETLLRPSALTDFQAFTANDLSYASSATTTGPIFVGEDNAGNPSNLVHDGTAKANLYAEGTVSADGNALVRYKLTLQNGAKAYDKNSTPTAICKLNNCNTISFSQFANYFPKVKGTADAEGAPWDFGTTDTGNIALKNQSPAYKVDAWNFSFQSNGTVVVSSCIDNTYSWYDSWARKTYYYTDDYGDVAPTCGNAHTYTLPPQGAIYAQADVIVSGTVKGKITLATTGAAVFGGNTTYNQNGTDVLGVMSQGPIYVATWGQTDPETIWAAMFSQNGPLTQDPNYHGNPVGTLNLYSSIAVYGQTSGSSIVMSGLFRYRNYNYDSNLLYVPPPIWPTLGNAYVILVQREV